MRFKGYRCESSMPFITTKAFPLNYDKSPIKANTNMSPTLQSSTHLSPYPLFTKIPMTHGPFHLNSILLTWPCCLLSTYYSLLAGQLVAGEFLGSLLLKYFLTFLVIYCFYAFLLNPTCVVRPSSLLFIVHIISTIAFFKN